MMVLTPACRLVLAVMVAAMPLQPCCCLADAAPARSAAIGTSAEAPGTTCCRKPDRAPDTPAVPAPCHDDGRTPGTTPHQCELKADCNSAEPFVPSSGVEPTTLSMSFEPLPACVVEVLTIAPILSFETDVGVFHGETLRALSCLLTI